MQEIEHDFNAGASTTTGHARADLVACYQRFLGHDLPNRLLGAQGLARIVLADPDLPTSATIRPLLERLADLIRLADEEVRQLATLGRLVRDMEPPTPVDLGELCRETVAEARWLCTDPGIVYHIGDDLPIAAVSVSLARAILIQVLRLAAAARQPGKPLHVELAVETHADDVVFHVRHDGLGLSAEQLGLLAELWLHGQADHASLGPGWLLVRHLVAACGGAIRVRSGPDEGTIVSLTLRVPPNFRGLIR